MADGGEGTVSELLRDKTSRSRFISDESIFAGCGDDAPDKQFEVEEEETKGHSFSLFRQRRPKPCFSHAELTGPFGLDDDDMIFETVQSPTFGPKPGQHGDHKFRGGKVVAENLNIFDLNEPLLPKIHTQSPLVSEISCNSSKKKKKFDLLEQLNLAGLSHITASSNPTMSSPRVDMTAPDTPTGNEFSFMSPVRLENENVMIVDEKVLSPTQKPVSSTSVEVKVSPST